jgi:heterodisulfide reductase subunit C/nitrate reductase gamma subunit
MLFQILLYSSLFVCLFGLVCRFRLWFKLKIGPDSGRYSAWERFAAVNQCLFGALFSRHAPIFLKTLVLDVLVQIRIMREDFLRWTMHTLIVCGFILLLLMHALSGQISSALFPEYEPTLNPFMFLRNLFGAMVLIGLAIAVIRRLKLPVLKLATRKRDWYAILILAAIIVSGFILEGIKIISAPVFMEMAEDYAYLYEEELEALKSYWVQDYNMVFPGETLEMDDDTVALGAELHEENCAYCHSRPAWAFVSSPIAGLIKPLAEWSAKVRADRWFWWIHVLICLVGLAILPFTKFFHIFSTPIKLMTRGLITEKCGRPVNVATRRAMELDSCTRCGLCSMNCSVNVHAQCLGNNFILPSEKLYMSTKFALGRRFNSKEILDFQEGSFVCTSCYRCTEVCPVGIDLQDLWLALKQDLINSGFEDPKAWAKRVRSNQLTNSLNFDSASRSLGEQPLLTQVGLSAQAEMFSACFQCQTCSGICPVAALYPDPREELDFLPHQVMHALGLGMRDIAMGSRMIWDCTTCYLCQEYCPQGIPVTDIFYELKALSYNGLKNER